MINKIEFTSNNCVKVSSTNYMHTYKVQATKNNIVGFCYLMEYDKQRDEYKTIYQSANVHSFIDYIEHKHIKKYFSFRNEQLIDFMKGEE